MPNIFGWGNDEPQILPKEQGGDTIAVFASKIKNLFQNLFNTLNSYPWSNATQAAAGYMSAEDKAALDGVPTTYLPLSGGTLTGAVVFSGLGQIIKQADNAHQISILSGINGNSQQGAKIILNGASYSSDPGAFVLQAGDVGEYMQLLGKPDGTLTWGGAPIATVADMLLSSTVSAYPYKLVCKLPNGLMLEGGAISEVTDANSRVTWTYPEAFYESPFVSVLKSDAAMSLNWFSLNKTRIILRVNNMSGSQIGQGMLVTACFIALGRWK